MERIPQRIEPGEPLAMTAKQQFAQKAITLATKAALSSIPWAALVFDFGQATVDFGNARLIDRYLEELGQRVEKLEGGPSRLKLDEIYQISAQSAIRRLLTETHPHMADALGRAVSQLGAIDMETSRRLEMARALDVLTEPSLHLLQTLARFHADQLTRAEQVITADKTGRDAKFDFLLIQSMPLLSWVMPINELQNSGMIESVIDAVEFDPGSNDTVTTMAAFKVYPLGQEVLDLCFEHPEVPAFGKFAT